MGDMVLTKLLVIDHDTMGDDYVKLTLNSAGFDVLMVKSSKAGINAAQSWEPEIIILNLLIPSSNGWCVCQELRKFSRAPILILSAISDPNSIAQWLDAGADEYLTKPVSTEVLIAHLHTLTRRTDPNYKFPTIPVML